MSNRTYTATYYTDLGEKAVGLSPTIDIWDWTTSTQVVTAASAYEVGAGGYAYVFNETDGHSYRSTFDAGNVPGLSYRYSEGNSTPDYTLTLSTIQSMINTNQTILVNHLLDIKGTGWLDQSLVSISELLSGITTNWGGYGE